MEPTMTVEEAQRLYLKGVDVITRLGQVVTVFEEFKGVFESRGGAVGMGPEYGPDAELLVGVCNNLLAMLAANNGWDQKVIDEHRNDY